MLLIILARCALFADGVLAGVFLCSCLVEQAMRECGGASWLDYKNGKERVFGSIMPAFFNAALLATIATAVAGFAPIVFAAASGLLAAALLITVRVHLPLNATIGHWTVEGMPADWRMCRTRWRNWNWVRCALVMMAFGGIVAGV